MMGGVSLGLEGVYISDLAFLLALVEESLGCC
jgi:hypothetical protein